MAAKSDLQQFVLMPSRGMRATAATSSADLGRFFLDLLPPSGMNALAPGAGVFRSFKLPGTPNVSEVEMRVLDTIHEDGPKLVEISPDSISSLRAHQPGLRLVPVVYYEPAVIGPPLPESKPSGAGTTTSVRIALKIVSKGTKKPISGATVVAFTDFENRDGLQGKTNSNGEVRFAFGASSRQLARLYIVPEKGFWGILRKKITISSGMEFELTPLNLGYRDVVRHFYGDSPDDAGAGIRVGVVDSGIESHPDLVIDGGENTVVGENSTDIGDSGLMHGTHVAGIVAARGKPPAGIRGVAPAAVLRSYRVFGNGDETASNYSIAKAIDRAVADQCDLINLSLGGGPTDELIRAAISDARSQGSVIIAASGNDDRSPVSFPASDSLAIAVSAMGRKGTFPRGATEAGDVASPYGTDKKNFIAAFSNVGIEIDVTGPGVGVISTVPGGYAVMGGTSMACPAVTGMAARLLSPRNDILSTGRDETRSDAIVRLILERARELGFGRTFEGQGIIMP